MGASVFVKENINRYYHENEDESVRPFVWQFVTDIKVDNALSGIIIRKERLTKVFAPGAVHAPTKKG